MILQTHIHNTVWSAVNKLSLFW